MALHMAGHTRSLRPQQVGPCRPLSLNRRRSLVATPAVLAPQPSVATVEASGGYETAWYAWPEGYLGQSFNLAGKMEPRATALRDDIDKLAQFCQFRREESQFSEHTITSAEDAAMMVSAVVGADVDMGLLKAGGSANFEMYQTYKSNTISHNLVASFQQNQLLEKNQLRLSHEAKNVLRNLGPQEFRARYGTHFASGIGYRGAFIGSINIRMQERSQSIAAGASFKASYGKFSGMGDVKAAMKNAGIDCEVTVEWSKWGADDDATLDELEENCASDNASITGIRQLAMQTADRAQGYPKLIKLRPYSTLPDYVEVMAQSGSPLPALFDQEPAMAYLTDRYRRAAYILSALERERRTGCTTNVSRIETTTRLLIADLEDAFKNKQALTDLGYYFKNNYSVPGWLPPSAMRDPGAREARAAGQALVNSIDGRVFPLDFDLFKYIQKPIYMQTPFTGKMYNTNAADGGQSGPEPDYKVHLAAMSSGDAATPLGAWFLDYTEQESFTQPGFYIVMLGLYDGVFQQIGTTQRFKNTEDDGKAANRFLAGAMTYGTDKSTVLLAFKVGDCCSKWPRGDTVLVQLATMFKLDCKPDGDLEAHRSWAGVTYPGVPSPSFLGFGTRQECLRSRNGSGETARKTPDNMVLFEINLKYF